MYQQVMIYALNGCKNVAVRTTTDYCVVRRYCSLDTSPYYYASISAFCSAIRQTRCSWPLPLYVLNAQAQQNSALDTRPLPATTKLQLESGACSCSLHVWSLY